MDVSTVVGLVAGLGLVAVTMVFGGNPLAFWNLPSVLLVIGGTFAATLLHYRFREIVGVFSALRRAVADREEPEEQLIARLVAFAGIARREGVLTLDAHIAHDEEPFLARGVQLVIDGLPGDAIKDILTTDIAFMQERHLRGQAILTTMGTFSPAFGMIGTLLGLVQMMTKLSEPSQIGQGMAVALLTTLYGAVLAYVVFLPAAGKLKVRTAREVFQKEIILEGVLSLQAGDNPRVTEQKLKSFVGAAVRERIDEERRQSRGKIR